MRKVGPYPNVPRDEGGRLMPKSKWRRHVKAMAYGYLSLFIFLIGLALLSVVAKVYG